VPLTANKLVGLVQRVVESMELFGRGYFGSIGDGSLGELRVTFWLRSLPNLS
jgi:hypothetical protein